MLALILVQALYLHIKNRIGVKRDSHIFLDVIGKAHLVYALNITQLCKNLFIVLISIELLQLLGVLLVNTARGTLIDPDALIAGLESGKIGGAGLDVIEDETGIYYYNRMGQAIPNRELNLLRSYPNVIVSPHTAFYTDVNVASMVQSPFEALDAYAHGQPYAGEVQL